MEPRVIAALVCCIVILACVVCGGSLLYYFTWGPGASGGDSTSLQPPQVQGSTTTVAASAVASVVQLASTSADPKAVKRKIKELNIAGFRTDDFNAAMKSLPVAKQLAAIAMFEKVAAAQSSSEIEAKFHLAALFYLQSPDAPTIQKEVEASARAVDCPAGWTGCDKPPFSKYNPNMSAVLDLTMTSPQTKYKNTGRAFCCRYGNAANDPRPEVQKSVDKARNWSKVLLPVAIILAVFAFFINPAAGMLVDLVTMNAMGLAEGVNQRGFMGGRIDVMFDRGVPFRSCVKPPGLDDFTSKNPNQVYVHRWVGEDGQPAYAFYQPNGCPISAAHVDVAQFGEQVLRMFKRHKGTDAIDPVKGELKFMSFEDFDPKKIPITCYATPDQKKNKINCLTKTSPLALARGTVCPDSLTCDQSKEAEYQRFLNCTGDVGRRECKSQGFSSSCMRNAGRRECERLGIRNPYPDAPPAPPPDPNSKQAKYDQCVRDKQRPQGRGLNGLTLAQAQKACQSLK